MSLKLKKREVKAMKGKEQIVVEFPAENEVISNPDYSIRIESGSTGFVEVSIDGGEWVSCYNSVGYWWFYWSHYGPGEHKIIARLCDENGCVVKESEVRSCRYKV